MTTPTPAQLASYEQMADSKNVAPPVRQALRHLVREVMESHAHRAVLTEQVHSLREANAR